MPATPAHWLPALHTFLRDHFALSGTLHPLAGEQDANFRLHTDGGRNFLLKVSHPDADASWWLMQAVLMGHLAQKPLGVAVQQVVPTLAGQEHLAWEAPDGTLRWVRLLTWVEGRLWAELPHHDSALLSSLGHACGQLTTALADCTLPAAHRPGFKWDLAQCLWITAHLDAVTDPDRHRLLKHFIALYRREVLPLLPHLPQGLIYNDANDHNIVVQGDATEGWAVHGLIDFGDAVHSHRVNEVAVAAAYACMDKPDVLGALAVVVRGFHTACPLTEVEVAAIFPLTAMRLCVSVVNSARNRTAHPDNVYLMVSERPAWDLLARMADVPPLLAHYALRHACGWVPCQAQPLFEAWVKAQPGGAYGPVLALPADTPSTTLDLGVGSTALGGNDVFGEVGRFEWAIRRMLWEMGARLGLGGYGEVRPFYTSDAYEVEGNEGPRWRTTHLGLDLWVEAGTPVLAPLAGTVHSFRDNAQDNDYGPTILLRHEPAGGPVFYTLYGHLTRTDLPPLRVGQSIAAGQCIAHVGPPPENGNWPPHLHFQILLDTLGKEGDFPGVAFADEWPVWASLCPDPLLLLGAHYTVSPPALPKAADIQARRAACLGPNLSLSYRPPLHIVRGYMPYLYDDKARRYLDTVNNVAHVGHEHPAVVRAGQRQMAVLNTNTRYLHQEMVQFAEELLATFPPELSVCYFVNSGSEATELALRMVRTATGRQDMLAVEVGYHGNSGGCIAVSAYKFDGRGGAGAPEYTHVVPMPDVYRGPYRGADAGVRYAGHVGAAIVAVEAAGRGVAGFIAESILSCGGQVVPPPGYLAAAYAQVRAAGGLCIADEVQTGLGRVGEAFWAFRLQGVVPDIVTVGKPLGNGHPVAAVVVTRAVAEAFANGMEYFNTFGGNPVSCAIGRAVLRTVQEEGLAAKAADTGAYLMEGLRQMQTRCPGLGDVRGEGLFLGLEWVTDPDARVPDPNTAAAIAQWMCRYGVLMSTDGPHLNVLKIKPPLCFGRREADVLLERLETVIEVIGQSWKLEI